MSSTEDVDFSPRRFELPRNSAQYHLLVYNGDYKRLCNQSADAGRVYASPLASISSRNLCPRCQVAKHRMIEADTDDLTIDENTPRMRVGVDGGESA